MKMSAAKLWQLAERILKRTESYQSNREVGMPDDENFKLDYLLVKESANTSMKVAAFASCEDMVLLLRPLEKDFNKQSFWYWSFDYDSGLFEYLEDGYKLADMSLCCHYAVWQTIEDLHEGDIDYTKGMQMYLDYCKKNGITRELLKQQASFDGMDVMKLYKPQFLPRVKHEKERER